MSDSLSNFAFDLGGLLKEKAMAAKQSSMCAEEPDRQFELGRLMAYYEVLSLITQQAQAFGLSPDTLGLGSFDPDSELLTEGSNR